MFRPLVALVVISSFASSLVAADPITFAEPLNIGAEMNKINSVYYKAQSQALRDRAAYAKALADRNEALGQLAAAAEAAKSTDHQGLANVYFLLQRYNDAVREARAAVQSKETDFASHVTLISSLSNLQKLDEAAAAFRKLAEQNVAETESSIYLNSGTNAVMILAGRLASAEKFAEAEQLVNDWQAKLDKLEIQKEPVEKMRERAKASLGSLRSRIASGKKRAELVGKPHFPIEGATWLNGAPVTSEELRGKVVLLDFWAVWCGPCIATFPHLRDWHDKYGDKGLVIIGVTRRYGYDWDTVANRPNRVEELAPETEDAATMAFLKHHELKHRIAVMADNAISVKYLVTGIPQAVVIDKQGAIRQIRVGSGEANAKALEQTIREALELKPDAAGE